MTICLGTDSDNLHSTMAKRFGNATWYLIYHTDSRSVTAIKNEKGNPDSEGHPHSQKNHISDHQHLKKNDLWKLIDEYKPDVFIVGNIGPQLFKRIKKHPINIFLARRMTGKQALDNFKDGNLEELSEPTAKKSIRKN